MAKVAEELQLDMDLVSGAKSLRECPVPTENFEAIKQGYNSVNKIFKQIRKGTALKKVV